MREGGNYHIKGKEFKINLISLPPSTPLGRVYSEHAPSCRETQGEHRESEMERARKRARPDGGN